MDPVMIIATLAIAVLLAVMIIAYLAWALIRLEARHRLLRADYCQLRHETRKRTLAVGRAVGEAHR